MGLAEGESLLSREGCWGESDVYTGPVFWRVGVKGPFEATTGFVPPTVFLRFLYSFKETDFLVVGVAFIGGGGDFRACLLGGVFVRVSDGGEASRLRL